jgi:predicted NBD/HSP70 family sugar kinase
LSQHCGLTKSTVSALVRELLDEHWLSEASAPVAADGLGRPSTPLQINGRVRVLLGVEIGVQQLRVVSVSLTGTVMGVLQEPLVNLDAGAVCAQAAALVHAAWRTLSARALVVSGVGVCLPGAIDEAAGLVRFAPNLGWRDLPIFAWMAQALRATGLPVTHLSLNNDADAAALGEYEFADGASADPLIFVSCDVGVGAGIVLNDHLFSGARGMAGEIGHSILEVGGRLCSCGRSGCAETFIGARALDSSLGVQRAGAALGVLIQNLDVMFNPRAIVVGGSSCSRFPELLAIATATAAGYADSAGVPTPPVRPARYGELAAAVGAAAVAWHHSLRPMLHRAAAAASIPLESTP